MFVRSVFITVLLAVLLAALVGSYATANPAKASKAEPSRKEATQKPTPADIFREGIYRLQEFMNSDQVNDVAARNQFISKYVKPQFDIEKMAKLVAGKHYKQMSYEQKQVFINQLGGMFFRGFTEHLVASSGKQPEIQFLKRRKNRDEGLVDVMARAVYADGGSTRLVFRFADSDKGWRVYDVSADGSSAVLYYRQNFDQIAQQM